MIVAAAVVVVAAVAAAGAVVVVVAAVARVHVFTFIDGGLQPVETISFNSSDNPNMISMTTMTTVPTFSGHLKITFGTFQTFSLL